MQHADKAAAQAAFEAAKAQMRRVEEPVSKPGGSEGQAPAAAPVTKASASSVWAKNILKQKQESLVTKPAPARRGIIGVKRKSEAPAAEEPAKKAPVGLGLGYSSSGSGSDDSPPRVS
eukprot:TRINITY_DN5631_c0_g2_i1.p1 TRINITY_DN5631_c0_g2~~TRINITY_DN5631_c0_g2_i1.p1  ORF type:complete len:118 (+),score=28.64 TRINITY_DN5631_c0_g2_i1:167-520(+)